MKTTLKQREIAVIAYAAARGVLKVDPVMKSVGKDTIHRVSLKIAARALQSLVKEVVDEATCTTEVVRWLIVAGRVGTNHQTGETRCVTTRCRNGTTS